MSVKRWPVHLAAAAEADFEGILRWTFEQFGQAQGHTYAATLSAAIEALAQGPAVVGARRRDDIAKGLRTLHVARQGRKGRHFVMFRTGKRADGPCIEVLRILHDAMDFWRHVPDADET
jgi:toxin ParE1/3/4